MKRTSSWDTVRKIGLTLPEVEEDTTWGSPSLKVRGKLMACIAINKSAEPNSLVVRMDFDQRDHLLAEAPEIYYVTDHYVNYPSVLARLPRLNEDALRDLLQTAWRFVTATTPKRKPKVLKTSRLTARSRHPKSI